MRGPPRKPTHLKLLQGNPGKRRLNRNEPQPLKAPAVPEPPGYLNGHAAAEWRRIAPELYHMGLLTIADETVLGVYCDAYERWRLAVDAWTRVQERDAMFSGLMVKSGKRGTPIQNPLFLAMRQATSDMMRAGAEFGFSPAARARLNNPLGPPPGPGKFDGRIA
jgi:P27 family predicted phage terminase small subunit